MEWQGFIKESKKYMNHPDYWTEYSSILYRENGWTVADKRKAAIKFWILFPIPCVKFYCYTLRDWIVKQYYKWEVK